METKDSEVGKKETDNSEATEKETEDFEATKKETEDSEATKKDTEHLEATTDESKESSLTSTPISSPSKSTDQSLSSMSPALSSPLGPLSGRVELKSGKVPKVSSIPGVGVRGVSAVLSQDTVRGGLCVVLCLKHWLNERCRYRYMYIPCTCTCRLHYSICESL